MSRLKIVLIIIAFLAASCEEMDSLFKEKDTGLSEEEVVKGLKTALEVGSDTAVAVTSERNGYYRDEAIKIMLPPEADIIYEHKDDALFQSLGLDQLIDDAVLSINRSAEDAASEASPILRDAITSLSISGGRDILNGKNPADSNAQQEAFDSTAAANYLKSTTYNDLFNAFKPRFDESLKKELVGGVSTKQIWNELTSTYNSVASVAGMETVDTELETYVTEKALDGLFLKVANEEKEIRKDPTQWAGTLVEDILKKVFSS
ncbi:MAG: DUF4197 domain-containing protein [Bacteroidota bacterium]